MRINCKKSVRLPTEIFKPYHYDLYENMGLRGNNYIGQTEASSPEEAFKSITGNYYKIDLTAADIRADEITQNNYQIFIKESLYILKKS